MKSFFVVTFLARVAVAAHPDFDRQVDLYFREYLRANPTSASDLGVHDYDSDLEDFSAEALGREVGRLHRWQEALDKMTAPTEPEPELEIDRELWRAHVR